jgi:pyruvate dehydrogenase E2 component (dihydrolipoamide acetyltransferase)
VTAILLKAIGLAQRAHPASRSISLPGGRIAILENIVAGFTVERLVGDEPAVFFGTIEAPDCKPLTVMMDELRQYSRSDILSHPKLSIQQRFSEMPWIFRQVFLQLALTFPRIRQHFLGASFGLSSLGKYGVTAVAGPPVCSSTFGVGVTESRPVVRDGKIEIHPMMTISLNFDQRVLDGISASRFLDEVKTLMEGALSKYLPEDDRDPGDSPGVVQGFPQAFITTTHLDKAI